ncbi:hypothetical protein [Candidatus Albibeggiatoa sp. nov. NOAA]|uniref:hypothetical protein n=1 Tax=Candidatus Albibeggiatoa sp. nov. NOAA TaxID=3162724 RepID=UPI0033030C13|nr:hypothetical protein [Thiotrichaceae bacterium]
MTQPPTDSQSATSSSTRGAKTGAQPYTPIEAQAETMECGAAIGRGQMEQFVKSFQQSARRWEGIVYPALFAFAVLAAYGFFLIYSLTGDMRSIARSIDPDMAEHMASMSKNIGDLSKQISTMTVTMNEISLKLDTLPPMLKYMGYMEQAMVRMDESITGMDSSITRMDESMARMDGAINRMDLSMAEMNGSMERMTETMRTMSVSTDQMRHDVAKMSYGLTNLSRPMSFVNSFPMPW